MGFGVRRPRVRSQFSYLLDEWFQLSNLTLISSDSSPIKWDDIIYFSRTVDKLNRAIIKTSEKQLSFYRLLKFRYSESKTPRTPTSLSPRGVGEDENISIYCQGS